MEKLEDRFQTLEREMKAATLDYLDIYAKARKLFGRIAKAMDRQDEADSSSSADAPGNGDAHASPLSGGDFAHAPPLSGRAAEAQRRILARRARIMGGGGGT